MISTKTKLWILIRTSVCRSLLLIQVLSPPNMDVDPPQPLWTPDMALRSKNQVLLEEWKTLDISKAWQNTRECHFAPAPSDLKTWTTLTPRALTLFYQAQSSPPLPSMKEIRDATAKDPLHAINGGHNVCRMGGTVIKYGYYPSVMEVSKFCPS
jgi:hypothetical protein